MVWMIQPHNWVQAVRPNLYNVGYRRNLAYKGMGRGMGQLYRPGTVPLGRYLSTGMGQTDLSTMPDLPVPQPPPLATTGTYMTPQGPVNVSGGVYMGSATTTQQQTTNWLPWIIGGVLVLVLIGSRR